MNNPLRKAIIVATGNEIQVYKLSNGSWCDYSDCATEYKCDPKGNCNDLRIGAIIT